MVGWGTHRYQSDITEPTGMTCTRPKPYTPDAALPAPLSFKLIHAERPQSAERFHMLLIEQMDRLSPSHS